MIGGLNVELQPEASESFCLTVFAKKVEVAVAQMFTQDYLRLCKFDYKLKIHKQMRCLMS